MIFRSYLSALILLSAAALEAQVASDSLPYDRVQQKSAHNAYQRHETLAAMLNEHAIRSLELDIHIDKLGRPRLKGNWYVYHTMSDGKSSVDTLSQGLGILRQYHEAHPQHEVITLWMDIKQDFTNSHTPDALDQIFDEHLGDSLFTPADLWKSCPGARDLQDTVQTHDCVWPDTNTLRGRFLIVLTESPVLGYIDQGRKALTRRAFVAPRITQATEAAQQRFAIFFNMEKSVTSNPGLMQKAQTARLVTRTWGLNDRKSWQAAASLGINHLATDKVNASKDPWATTEQENGDPFAVVPDPIP